MFSGSTLSSELTVVANHSNRITRVVTQDLTREIRQMTDSGIQVRASRFGSLNFVDFSCYENKTK